MAFRERIRQANETRTNHKSGMELAARGTVEKFELQITGDLKRPVLENPGGLGWIDFKCLLRLWA